MAFYDRGDMVYSNYSWTTYGDDDPKVTGEPDSTLLNRSEGYEVLYFINKMAEIHSLSNVSSGNKMERMIREDVPSDIRSQANIKNWIENNWD